MKKFICFAVMVSCLCMSVFAEGWLTKESFFEAADIWNEAQATQSFVKYQNKLMDITTSSVPEELYPYAFAECFFYKYFAVPASKGSEAVISESENLLNLVDNLLFSILPYESDIKTIKLAHVFFENAFTGDDSPLLSEIDNSKPVALPDAVSERIALLHSISEIEAMMNRFAASSASASEHEVLRFSEEAYFRAKAKPGIVFVLKNEPAYKELRLAFERTEKASDVKSFGENADAVYALQEAIIKADEAFAEKGISRKALLPSDVYDALVYYHNDPFVLCCMDKGSVRQIADVLNVAVDLINLYADRISFIKAY